MKKRRNRVFRSMDELRRAYFPKEWAEEQERRAVQAGPEAYGRYLARQAIKDMSKLLRRFARKVAQVRP